MSTFEIVELTPQPTAVVRGTVGWADLRDIFDRGFTSVYATLGAQGVQMVGAPFGFYPTPPGDAVTVEVGTVVATPITADGDVQPGELPGGRMIRTMHVGSYDELPKTYAAVAAWAREQGVTLGASMWEAYLDDPSVATDPTTWRTEIYWVLAD